MKRIDITTPVTDPLALNCRILGVVISLKRDDTSASISLEPDDDDDDSRDGMRVPSDHSQKVSKFDI